jgi:hypothetical protein
LVEKWIPPSRSETAGFGQKTEGILGVNHLFVKLIILCNPLLNVSHIQKGYQNDII